MKVPKTIASGILIILTSVVFVTSSFAVVLPPADLPIDGVQTAIPYDDFWSYSNQILMSIQKESPALLPTSVYGNFDFATGTGGLDIILYTGAGGADNQAIGPGGLFNFEDPVRSPSGSTTSIDGWWGQNDQDNDGSLDNVNGPVTVGQILDYLQAFDPSFNTPVFYMDMNQTGNNQPLSFYGRVTLLDPSSLDIVEEWSFDAFDQPAGPPGSGLAVPGDFDIAPILTIGEIPSLIGTSGTEYGPINHNLGSGKADYIAYAPTMNLSLFPRDWFFVTEFRMAALDGGFEEIFLSALAIPQPPAPIPEPSTFVLLAVGLLGLGFVGWRKSKK
jgi:hypothetical protein